jgi:glyoxylase-like metal-dependent hydrolase (beta-lactamase superfamily II)
MRSSTAEPVRPAICAICAITVVAVAVCLALTAACSSPGMGASAASPAAAGSTDVVAAAVRAVGGRAAVEAASSLVIEGTGQAYFLGQSREPDGQPLWFEITRFRRVIDLAGGRWRDEAVLTPRYPTGYPDPRHMIMAVDGEVGYDVGDDGVAARATAADARDRRRELLHSPVGILRAALAPGAAVSRARRVGGRDEVEIRTAGGEVFTLVVDPGSGLPAQVRSMTDQPNLGDVQMVTDFSDYRPAGALRLPARITSRMDRQLLADLRVTRSVTGAAETDLAALAAPDSVRSAAPPPQPPRVAVELLAPGVWLLHGEGHHSVAVEFADHITLIEAPVDDARTLAVIAAARKLQPAKPLTQVVMTHHHFDHSGGVRAAIAEGLTVIAHEKAARFVEEMAARKHTIAPDALARKPRRLQMESVSGRMVMRDALRTMELHAVDTAHASTMLVAYLPAERLLVEVDLYTAPADGAPPPTWYPFAAPLLRAIQAQKMTVDRIVPLHRTMVSYADLAAAAGQPRPAR